MTWRSVLAAVGLVSAPALLSAEPIDFHIVSRPEHWGGLELPGKPASNQQRRLHGAVVPHLQPMEGALEGFESYRVYFILNEEAHVQNVYALFGDDYAAMTLRADEKGVGLFQVPIPFGADYGGVNQALYKVKASSEFDTWITVGADNGNPSNQISAVGLGTFDEILDVPDGAVFAMNPDQVPEGDDARPKELVGQGAMLIAQITIPKGKTFTGHFNAQGRSSGHESDWQEYGICFSTGKGCSTHDTHDL